MQRKNDFLNSFFIPNDFETRFQIALAPSDIGVQKNYGRLGSRFAPQILLREFGLLQRPDSLPEKFSIGFHWVADICSEKSNFELAQIKQAEYLVKILSFPDKKLIHLGGGHDHVFALALGVRKAFPESPLFIINIDPHLDMRGDKQIHSGTPFRQILSLEAPAIKLIQWGAKNYANTLESRELAAKNFSPHQINILDDFEIDDFFEEHEKQLKQSKILISLDCDAISGFKAVSCPSREGIVWAKISQFILEMNKRYPYFTLGIYEANPLFDDLSNSELRIIPSLLYRIFF